MHGSILPVTMLPRTYPRGFAILLSLGGLFPTPGHAERDNSPPPGPKGRTCPRGCPGGGGGGLKGKIEPCIIFACHQITIDPFIPICFVLQSIQTC